MLLPVGLLFMVHAVVFFVGRFAGQVHAQLFQGVVVDAGEDDRGVHIAALQVGDLFHSLGGVLILGNRAGQRDQNLVGVQAGVLAAQVVRFSAFGSAR